jgi:hypothetical protein
VPPPAPLPTMMTSKRLSMPAPGYSPTLLCMMPPSAKMVVAVR